MQSCSVPCRYFFACHTATFFEQRYLTTSFCQFGHQIRLRFLAWLLFWLFFIFRPCLFRDRARDGVSPRGSPTFVSGRRRQFFGEIVAVQCLYLGHAALAVEYDKSIQPQLSFRVCHLFVCVSSNSVTCRLPWCWLCFVGGTKGFWFLG
jgi:hypothetical protein